MSVFEASRYVARVDLIDPGQLQREGVRLVLLDRDNTCVPRDTWVVPGAIRRWFDEAHRLGLATCLVSNNFHGRGVEATAADLGSAAVHHAMKPAPFALWHALRRAGVPAQEAVLVGDQVFTDVVAGNLAGVRTILVRPQSTSDLWYTQVFRLFEGLALRGHRFEGEGRGAAEAPGGEATRP